jgi:hypothetical protein
MPPGLARWMPGLATLREYHLFWLRHDIVAAIVLKTMLVPVGIACAVASGQAGETGVMTLIVNHNSDVYEKDLGPDTAQAAAINVFQSRQVVGQGQHDAGKVRMNAARP